MSRLEAKLCPLCFGNLRAKGEFLTHTYLSICQEYLSNGKLTVRGGVSGRGCTSIHYLESQNYITTTENGIWDINIKPTNHTDDQWLTFCRCRTDE